MSVVKKDRREFLRRLARQAALGALAGGIAALIARRRPEGESCSNDGICRGCPAYHGCGLPQALTMREALRKDVP